MKVIHDLKNPILSIKNNLLDFKMNPESVIKTTQLDCEDMEEMLENMRAEFKIKQGMQLKEEIKAVETTEFAKSLGSTHSALTENGQNFLHISIDNNYPKTLNIQRTLIKRIANNFITNSLKHTEKGHV
jgi:signal transduction histidine kinase